MFQRKALMNAELTRPPGRAGPLRRHRRVDGTVCRSLSCSILFPTFPDALILYHIAAVTRAAESTHGIAAQLTIHRILPILKEAIPYDVGVRPRAPATATKEGRHEETCIAVRPRRRHLLVGACAHRGGMRGRAPPRARDPT